VKDKIESLKRQSQAGDDEVSHIMYSLLTKEMDKAGLEGIIHKHIDAVERGAVRLSAFLARTAPLAGLAGTLVGVQHALAGFSKQVDNPYQIVTGFSTALVTTLVGILVAILCVAISKLIWEPGLNKLMFQLFDFSLTARTYVCEIKRRLRGDN